MVPPVATVFAGLAWLPASWIAAVATFFAGLPGARSPWPTGLLGVVLLTAVTVAGLMAVLGGVRLPVRRAARITWDCAGQRNVKRAHAIRFQCR